MKSAATSALFLLTSALLAGACAADDEGLEFRDSSGGGWGCIGCGSNSPHVNDYAIPELNLAGLVNDDGVRLRGILDAGGTRYTLDLVDDNLVARDSGGAIAASGTWLIGWRIALRGDDGVTRYVYIRDVHTIASWAAGAEPIEGYALAYVDPAEPDVFKNVCPEVEGDPDAVAVTAIAGETYDRELKLVNAGMTDWFTLACAGEATYKMKLMNYGPNDDFDGTTAPASVAQRQATIKMITGDYCGTGESYTEQGTPLQWRDAALTNNTWVAGAALEARWTEDGATCLSTPRLVAHATVGCALPTCSLLELPGTYTWKSWKP